ncbi:hypothetical protein M5K25_025987 [Dendrobium thyrsiflorum]|uniref:Uncharacterized protein n=1 Tax=Dendrobium thyrsiflorum TaxID=117978 RepID=A0ABD0TW44_DENTH
MGSKGFLGWTTQAVGISQGLSLLLDRIPMPVKQRHEPARPRLRVLADHLTFEGADLSKGKSVQSLEKNRAEAHRKKKPLHSSRVRAQHSHDPGEISPPTLLPSLALLEPKKLFSLSSVRTRQELKLLSSSLRPGLFPLSRSRSDFVQLRENERWRSLLLSLEQGDSPPRLHLLSRENPAEDPLALRSILPLSLSVLHATKQVETLRLASLSRHSAPTPPLLLFANTSQTRAASALPLCLGRTPRAGALSPSLPVRKAQQNRSPLSLFLPLLDLARWLCWLPIMLENMKHALELKLYENVSLKMEALGKIRWVYYSSLQVGFLVKHVNSLYAHPLFVHVSFLRGTTYPAQVAGLLALELLSGHARVRHIRLVNIRSFLSTLYSLFRFGQALDLSGEAPYTSFRFGQASIESSHSPFRFGQRAEAHRKKKPLHSSRVRAQHSHDPGEISPPTLLPSLALLEPKKLFSLSSVRTRQELKLLSSSLRPGLFPLSRSRSDFVQLRENERWRSLLLSLEQGDSPPRLHLLSRENPAEDPLALRSILPLSLSVLHATKQVETLRLASLSRHSAPTPPLLLFANTSQTRAASALPLCLGRTPRAGALSPSLPNSLYAHPLFVHVSFLRGTTYPAQVAGLLALELLSGHARVRYLLLHLHVGLQKTIPSQGVLFWNSIEDPESEIIGCNFGVVRRNSGRILASGGGSEELRRQVAVRRNSDVKWRSGGTPTSGGSPAKLRRQAAVRRNSGGGRGGVSSFSSSHLLLFSSCLGSSLMGNEGSIYRFLRLAWPVNKREIRASNSGLARVFDLGSPERGLSRIWCRWVRISETLSLTTTILLSSITRQRSFMTIVSHRLWSFQPPLPDNSLYDHCRLPTTVLQTSVTHQLRPSDLRSQTTVIPTSVARLRSFPPPSLDSGLSDQCCMPNTVLQTLITRLRSFRPPSIDYVPSILHHLTTVFLTTVAHQLRSFQPPSTDNGRCKGVQQHVVGLGPRGHQEEREVADQPVKDGWSLPCLQVHYLDEFEGVSLAEEEELLHGAVQIERPRLALVLEGEGSLLVVLVSVVEVLAGAEGSHSTRRHLGVRVLVGNPAELRRRAEVRQWSGLKLNVGPLSGASGLQVVVRWNVGPSGGGPAGRRAFRLWSGGGLAGLRRWLRRSKGARAAVSIPVSPPIEDIHFPPPRSPVKAPGPLALDPTAAMSPILHIGAITALTPAFLSANVGSRVTDGSLHASPRVCPQPLPRRSIRFSCPNFAVLV